MSGEQSDTIVAVEVEMPGQDETNYYHEACVNIVFPPGVEVEMVYQISQGEAEGEYDFTCDYCGARLAEAPRTMA